jgi:hypothetical protein
LSSSPVFPYTLSSGIQVAAPPPLFFASNPLPLATDAARQVGVISFANSTNPPIHIGTTFHFHPVPPNPLPAYPSEPSASLPRGFFVSEETKKELQEASVIKAEKNESVCTICLRNRANVSFSPCGCQALCTACALDASSKLPAKVCTNCRTPVQTIIVQKKKTE